MDAQASSVTENRSLDEFVPQADEESDGDDDAVEPQAEGGDDAVEPQAEGGDDAVEPETTSDTEAEEPESAVGGDAEAEDDGSTAADPAAPTYGWTPGGAPCAACGETVERRWRGDEGLVCGACKDW